jgi:hypothetical protein
MSYSRKRRMIFNKNNKDDLIFIAIYLIVGAVIAYLVRDNKGWNLIFQSIIAPLTVGIVLYTLQKMEDNSKEYFKKLDEKEED